MFKVVRIGDIGCKFVLDTLLGGGSNSRAASGTLNTVIREVELRNGRTFLDEDYDADLISHPNEGGITTTSCGKEGLVEDMLGHIRAEERVAVFYNPWDDYEYIRSLKRYDGIYIGSFEGKSFQSTPLSHISVELLDKINSKLSNLTVAFVARRNAATDGLELTDALWGVETFYVNAYDDESWIAADVSSISFSVTMKHPVPLR